MPQNNKYKEANELVLITYLSTLPDNLLSCAGLNYFLTVLTGSIYSSHGRFL